MDYNGEKVHIEIYQDPGEASYHAAWEIAELIRTKGKKGEKCVLGLATGSTPSQIYRHLVKEHRENGLSFKHVVTFNLDEYYPMDPSSLRSYHKFMWESLFKHVDILKENVHIPDGTLSEDDIDRYCDEYETKIFKAGSIDLQLLGLGRTGHIGFNESGSSEDSKTRMVFLNKTTRIDAASDFFAEEHVPRRAITMGLRTIMQAKRIILVAFGENKMNAVRQAVEENPSSKCAASILQKHPRTLLILDGAASAGLTRCKTPWITTELQWTKDEIRKAVIWLAQTTGKSILRLVSDDYSENHLEELILGRSAEKLNAEVFSHLMQTICQTPGKVQNNGSQVLESQSDEHQAKKVLIMSPHPDDDVISCGGTFIQLVEDGCEVHVAYQTSGNVAVSDEEALRFAEFLDAVSTVENSSTINLANIRRDLESKHPGQVDSDSVLELKKQIRYSEAKSAARVAGAKSENLHFLDMPFYQTGMVTKKPLGKDDVRIVVDLFRNVQPQQIYAAGDLSDPHGTHRTALQAIVLALDEVKDESWFKNTKVWLYRGAWQEYEPYEIEMAVPMSPERLKHKIEAIFRHQSQKDRAMFPGADSREFWQRARDRNKALAAVYRGLGLPDYEAMEAFVSYDPHSSSPFNSEYTKIE